MKSLSKIIKITRGHDGSDVEPFQGESLDEAFQDAPGGNGHSTDLMMDAAFREANEIKKRAHQEGYSEGKRTGQLEFKHEIQHLRGLYEELARSIQEEEHKWIADLAPKVVRLAIAVASKVLEREISADDGAVVNTVAKALRNIVERGNLVIRVNPADLDKVRKYKLELNQIMDGVKEVEVLADDTVGPGGAIVETDHVKSDARIATQLEQIAAELEDEWFRS